MQVTFFRVSEKIFAVERTPQFIVVGMTEARVLSEPLQRFFGETDSSIVLTDHHNSGRDRRCKTGGIELFRYGYSISPNM